MGVCRYDDSGAAKEVHLPDKGFGLLPGLFWCTGVTVGGTAGSPFGMPGVIVGMLVIGALIGLFGHWFNVALSGRPGLKWTVGIGVLIVLTLSSAFLKGHMKEKYTQAAKPDIFNEAAATRGNWLDDADRYFGKPAAVQPDLTRIPAKATEDIIRHREAQRAEVIADMERSEIKRKLEEQRMQIEEQNDLLRRMKSDQDADRIRRGIP